MGRERAAVLIAMACNCSESKPDQETILRTENADRNPPFTTTPCGSCKSCRKIESDNHPDIIRLRPSGALIKIEQVRSLCRTLAMKPYEARMRIVIITDARAMNPSAGNALLKVLEEPPLRTLIILVTEHASDLLPTMVSRCQHIRFNPISKPNLLRALVQEHGIDAAQAHVLADMAGGSITKALRMYGANWVRRRNWLIEELDALAAGPLNRTLAFAAQLAKNKDDLPDALALLKSWLRDLIVTKLHPGRIRDHDLALKLQQAAPNMNLPSLLTKFDTIQSTQNAIQTGTNLRLAMESMVLKLSRI